MNLDPKTAEIYYTFIYISTVYELRFTLRVFALKCINSTDNTVFLSVTGLPIALARNFF